MRRRAKKTLSYDERAAARAAEALRAGLLLTVNARRGYYTAGPYTPAVGEGGHAVYGYDGAEGPPAREYSGPDSAVEAAWALVRSCGSTRVREACLEASRRAVRGRAGNRRDTGGSSRRRRG